MSYIEQRRKRRILVVITMLIVVALLAWVNAEHHRHASKQGKRSAHAGDPGTIVIAQANDADTLDPSDVGSADTLNVARMLFGTLYDVSPEGNLQPFLAESYTYSEDGRAIHFKLRSGLACEDGSPLTASDVAYSFQRAANPSNHFTGNASGFLIPSIEYTGVTVEGPLDVTVHTSKYNPIAIGLISELSIMCRVPYEHMSLREASTHPSATGPYKLAEWVHDDRIVLERNPEFKLRTPRYDRVIWRVIPEGSTRTAELLAGDIDLTTGVPPDQIDAVRNSETAKIETVTSTRRIYVGFNMRKKFQDTDGGRAIQDVRVRQALQYAIDVPTVCEALLRTPCQRAATLVVPRNDTSGVPAFPFDPDKAEKLLDAAGYPRGKDGVRFHLRLQAPRTLYGDGNVAQAIGQYLSDIGVDTQVDLLDLSVYVLLTRQHEAGPLFLLGTGGSTWSALYDMSDLSAPNAGTNYTGWHDPAFFAGWKQLEQTKDAAEQQRIMNEMLQEFHAGAPWLMLYFQPDVYGVSNRIHWTPRADENITVY
ncbi:ABC transporter substrate-binding protein [Granulicella cerasi]|uniref:ABC transporter substrate-binding protein n=1 Tax=Granulicella cerasi TaxID=741063 RepID=UPI0021E0D5FE|nr:ABC transporter substrate-binding protein [Granulicella cerasi]